VSGITKESESHRQILSAKIYFSLYKAQTEALFLHSIGFSSCLSVFVGVYPTYMFVLKTNL